MPSTKPTKEQLMNHLMNNLTEKFITFIQDLRNVHREAKKQGFVNIMKLLWKDLFMGRTAFQWIFWIATNVFSIYLWWDQSIQIQGMYWVYTLNSLVGWYQWTKTLKKEVA